MKRLGCPQTKMETDCLMSGTVVEILIFALLAIFLILRLRSVLGRRDGYDGTASKGQALARSASGDASSEAPPAPSGEGVKAIVEADKSFSEQAFISGAEKAYRVILDSFAKGDMKQLKPLLGYEMAISFGDAIRDRRKSNEELEITIHDVRRVKIKKALLKEGIATIIVEIQSRQSRVMRAENGDIIDGSPKRVESFLDQWTFERDVASKNPNWHLVEAEAIAD